MRILFILLLPIHVFACQTCEELIWDLKQEIGRLEWNLDVHPCEYTLGKYEAYIEMREHLRYLIHKND
jgi:hypothetical protein